MHANLNSCPAETRLRQYLDGDLTLEPAELAHIQACLACQQTLDRLTDSDFLAPFQSAVSLGCHSLNFLGPALRSGDIGSINEFAIEEIVDTGGMGTVLRGYDQKLGRTIALKVLRDQNSSSSYSRFEAEVRAVAKLASPHIVPVYSIGRTSDHRPFMVMPFVDGENLARQLKKGPLTLRLAAEYVRQVASGLAVAHEAGLIHRDVKPANILIDSSDGLAKVIDFGLVREPASRGLTQINVVCGTPEYMSCEQAQRPDQIDARSDIYSLGITLYECMTGTTPFRGQPLEILEQHRSVEPVPPTRLNRLVSKDLETVCLKAIAKDPSRRYATVGDFGQDLANYLSGQPIQARPFSHLEKGLSWCKRNRAMALTITLLACSLVLGTVISTGLWLLARQSAAAANKLAQDLQLSRNRMRESVQKFQSKVFSDESLHWQMSEEFRTEMFRDVILYLDEFASLSSAQATEMQAIVESYLEVAQTAIQVGQYEQAAIAAQRALARGQPTGVAPSSDQLLRKSNAARILFAAHFRIGDQSREQLDSIARQSIAAAEDASRIKPNDVLIECNRFNALLTIWEARANTSGYNGIAGFDEDQSQTLVVRVNQAKRQLEELLPKATSIQERIALRRAQVQAQLLSIRLPIDAADAAELVRSFDANNLSLKESLRSAQKPLLECNRFSGRFRYLLGKSQLTSGNAGGAIESTGQSQIEYQKAVNMQPQNRRWRLELAETQRQLAECHWQLEEYLPARDSLNQAILHLVQVLETDPKDTSVRLTVIETLIRFGETCLSLEDFQGAYRGFYTAAQDCRLVMIEPELKEWGLQTRLWALVKSYDALDRFDSATEAARTNEHTKLWLNQLGNVFGPSVAAQAAETIEKRFSTTRPPWPEVVLPLQP